MGTKTCPQCGRVSALRAEWCLGCRHDFVTGQLRDAPTPSGAQARIFGTDYIGLIGDAGGEAQSMGHGEHSAWLHVFIAYCYGALIWGVALQALTRVLGIGGEFAQSSRGLFVMTFVGVLVCTAVFYNRWRCIEAFTSNWLTGFFHFSLLYAPVLALGYAYVRGAMKLWGR